MEAAPRADRCALLEQLIPIKELNPRYRALIAKDARLEEYLPGDKLIALDLSASALSCGDQECSQ